jgi:hypothetical protein
MFAIVPDPWLPGSVVVANGNNNGVEMDFSVSIRIEGEQPFTARTLVRTGTRMHSSGLVHGVATDAVDIAGMAATGLLLETFPSGLPRDEAKSQLEHVVAQAQTLARDSVRWSFRPVILDDVAFALRFRVLGQGFVAHADFGDCVMATWGTGPLPPELQRVKRVHSNVVPWSS